MVPAILKRCLWLLSISLLYSIGWGSGIYNPGSSGGTVTLSTMTTGATSYIFNQNTLQSGATFYVSSGTVRGNLYVDPILTLSNNTITMDSTSFNVTVATNSSFVTGRVLNITSPQGNGFLNMSPAGEIYFGGSSADLVFADRANPGISVSFVDYYLDTVYNHFSVANGFNVFSIDQNGRTAIAQSTYDTYTALNPPPAQLYVKDYLSSLPAVIVEGASSQSSNLQEWQNSSHTVLSSVSAAGVFSGDGSGLTNLQFPAVFTGSLFVGLTSGATFQAFIPTKAITLKNAVYTADVASAAGSGDTFTCTDISGNKVSVVSANAAAAGTTTSATGSANISAGTTVYMRIDSAAVTKPQGNFACGYVMQ